MAQSSAGTSAGPKILLAKPNVPRQESGAGGAGGVGGVVKLMRDRDEDTAARARLPNGALNLLSDAWDFQADRLLPLMSDNTDFTVVGVIGAPNVGKSTIMNELYGFDGNSPGVLPRFPVQSEETRLAARHCSVGIELRVSAERLILLDCQPIFSASVLLDLMRPDGCSNISVLSGESLSAELANEVMGLQLGVFLSSVCHILLVVSEGLYNYNSWKLVHTVDMLRQGIPDPSTLPVASPGQSFPVSVPESDISDLAEELQVQDYFADVVFIHTKIRKQDYFWPEIQRLGKALSLFFPSADFRKNVAIRYRPPQFPEVTCHRKHQEFLGKERGAPRGENGVISLSGLAPAVFDLEDDDGPASKDGKGKHTKNVDSVEQDTGVNFFVLPLKVPDEFTQYHHESYMTMLATLRNQILSMPRRSFAKPISERDWLRNAARIWDLVKKSPVLADYSKLLQTTGLYGK